jgi:hypothetical protein
MIDVFILEDKDCVIQVHGRETTRWLSFIKLMSLFKKEAFFAVSAVKDPTALNIVLLTSLILAYSISTE